MTTTTTTSGAADLLAMVSKALREAYYLGQRYWQQTDSEYISQYKKADDTRANFLALVEETCAALAAGQATAAPAGVPANMRLCYLCGHPADAHPWVNDPRGGKRRGDCPAAPAQPAAQQGVAYAALPEPYCNAHDDADAFYPDMFSEQQMRAFADATHTLRASHGQAPADAKALAEADRRAGEAERILATCKENVMRFEQVRSRMKYQWGADQRVSFDEVWDEALALKKAAQAAPTTQPSPAAQGDALDAARYRFLRDGEWRDTDLEPFIRLQLNTLWDAKIDAARKQGEKQ